MKKILVTGLLALSAITLAQQEASAWVNSRIGIGFNWDYQSGGNNFLWGLYRNGQPPGPEAYGHHGMPRPPYHPAPGMGVAPGFVPAPPQGFVPAPQGFGPAPAAPRSGYVPVYYGTPYVPASYLRPLYYYPTPYYYAQ